MNNKKFNGCDPLREWLEAAGFRIAHNNLKNEYNQCDWYAYKPSSLPARECECNNKKNMQLVIEPHDMVYFKHTGVEVCVTGQADNRWYNLRCYSVSVSELMTSIDKIEASLIAAWNALHPT